MSDPSTASSAAAVVWEGPQFATHSLSIVNRELCTRLLDRGVELRLEPFEAVPELLGERMERLAGRVDQRLSRAADVTVRHRWPPNFGAAATERLVVMQPWEFGSLPRAWIDPIQQNIDEIWAYTPFVRDCYVGSGVDPERVFLVPIGVDPSRFRPGVEPLPLATERRFRFLFVGGTIHRKGIDVLLQAYAQAFDASDDVCLVVKAMGVDTSYRGQHQRDAILALRDRPSAPEILYLEDDFCEADMPRLYAAADCLVHPYRGEGFGLPIAEAMACALPVVVTDRGAARAFCEEAWSYLIPSREVQLPSRFVGDIETVALPWLAEPDADALVNILKRVHAEPAEARRRGFAAREQIRTRFTWEHAAEAVEQRLEALRFGPSPRAKDPAQVAETDRTSVASRTSRSEDPVPVVWSAAPFNYSGYAKISRTLLPALERAGQPVQLKAFGTDERFAKDFDAEMRRAPAEAAVWSRLVERRISEGIGICIHPPVSWDGFRFFRNFRRENPGLDAYVGLTMFETDRIPADWAAECNSMDEVWVPSDWNREVFAESGVRLEKLRVFNPGIDVEPFRKLDEPFAIPDQRGFTFLSVFQWTRRKGWDVLLDAWANAFSADDDVCLALRAYPGSSHQAPIRDSIDAYLRATGRDRSRCAPILMIDDFIPDERMPSLYAAADAFVLPSRGEAWGLPYLEAMAMGLPTLAPNWGGQLQFMHEANSYLIEVEGLEPIDADQQRDNAYYTPDLRWAIPSSIHTAERMREVFEDPGTARERGRRAREEVFERWSVPAAVERFDALARDLGDRAPSRGAAPDRFAAPARVIWNSPLYDPSGYADEARQLVLGLDDLGMPVRCLPVPWSERKAELEPSEADLLSELEQRPLAGADLIHVQHAFGKHFRRSPTLRATVGRTMFETDRIPEDWIAPCNDLDEIWVPSQFNVETFAAAGVAREKLQVVPSPLDARRYTTLAEPVSVTGKRGFAFLSVFDWSLRKGWDLLLRAFAEEFAATEDVCLILKVSSSEGLELRQLQQRARRFLRKRVGRSHDAIPPLLWLDAQHSVAQMPSIYRAADAYVMPSRGEGWGRPYMEAMACGLPVIGTGWGGNTEYMNDANSYLLDYELVPVPAPALSEAPHFRGHHWAEPQRDDLRRRMREVFEDRDEARSRGARARREVLERFDRSVVARQIAERIEVLGSGSRL